jgi:hypothetical protein
MDGPEQSCLKISAQQAGAHSQSTSTFSQQRAQATQRVRRGSLSHVGPASETVDGASRRAGNLFRSSPLHLSVSGDLAIRLREVTQAALLLYDHSYTSVVVFDFLINFNYLFY